MTWVALLYSIVLAPAYGWVVMSELQDVAEGPEPGSPRFYRCPRYRQDPATRGATKVPHPESPRIYQMIDGQSLREDFSRR